MVKVLVFKLMLKYESFEESCTVAYHTLYACRDTHRVFKNYLKVKQGLRAQPGKQLPTPTHQQRLWSKLSPWKKHSDTPLPLPINSPINRRTTQKDTISTGSALGSLWSLRRNLSPMACISFRKPSEDILVQPLQALCCGRTKQRINLFTD